MNSATIYIESIHFMVSICFFMLLCYNGFNCRKEILNEYD